MRNADKEMILLINDQPAVLIGRDDLMQHPDSIRQMDYADISLERGDEVTMLMTNREQGRAFLMYLTDISGGFHAVIEDVINADMPIEFLLSNGQIDEWSMSETIALTDGLSALIHFYVNGGRSPFITWHDDSQ